MKLFGPPDALARDTGLESKLVASRQAAIQIVEKLNASGFQALLAGGCVRDMLLKRQAKDYDVATDAHPEKLIKLFKRTLTIGAKFGVVMVLIDDQQIEVATFRTESGYLDGRHPTNVSFSNAREDAQRRDFTINAMFFDPVSEKVIDYFGGQKDLKKKIIRTVGNANERFDEDYLRMLRAIRFSTQLNFKIEPATWKAICNNAKKITKISGERIAAELEGILTNPNRVKGIKLLFKSGLAKAIFPKLTCQNMFKVVKNLSRNADFVLVLAAFMSDYTPKKALKHLEVLKPSNFLMKNLHFLLENKGTLSKKQLSLAQLRLLLADKNFNLLLDFEKAILKSQNKSLEPLVKLGKRVKSLSGTELTPKPLLDGHELMQLGSEKGPALGKLCQKFYIAQLNNIFTDKASAEKWVKKCLQKHQK